LNRRIKKYLKRLKKITNKLEKKLANKRERINSWAKKISEISTTFSRSYLSLSVDIASPIRSLCEKFEIKVFIKREEKIKRIITTTTKNIVE